MTDDRQLIDLTRRKLLIGAGAIGLASAGAGLGTSALFSDRESFGNNVITAGTLDLLVHYDAVYNGAPAENLAPSPSGIADGAAELLYTLDDVKPGDSGTLEFCFEVNTNPAYLWFCTEQTADEENGQNEPELEAEGADTDGLGELDDEIIVDAFYCDTDGEPVDGGEIASAVSLAEFLAIYAVGHPLNADEEDVPAGDQTPYPASSEPGVTTGPCLCIEWELPAGVGNEVQSDSLAFDIAFHAVQARNTDGTLNPCCTCGPDEYAVRLPDGSVRCVTEFSGSESVQDFYDFRGQPDFYSGNSAIQDEDTTNVLVYHDTTNDTRSLVVISDNRDGEGGAVSVDLDFANSGSYQWVVEDDEPITSDSYTVGSSSATADWSWASDKTDGGAIGDLDPAFDIDLTARFNDMADIGRAFGIGDISTWQVIQPSGSGGPVVIADSIGTAGIEETVRLYKCRTD
jgi:predicted ribosomally synthesized peptide with SipW-like signal peptide